MIKIIISGTYDGFYSRYASDGILNDNVSQHLLDRCRYLSRGADRLYKEGYSFQLLNEGILLHKMMLLFDGFGRDGFMMASLFLPDGEMLDGKDIKDALDSVVREYKMHTVNGMTNFDIDWSFVRRKADELNTKVYPMVWKRRPVQGDNSRIALIKGVESRIADYFKYPNPLNAGCAGYGMVFLTESLLDPKMMSENGEQGYKILDSYQVDIDNPVYDIEYKNPNPFKINGLTNRSLTKKEIDAPGDILLDNISVPGYRHANVILSADKKVSKDGFTIEVELPLLVKKQSSVSLSIEAPDGKISLDECLVEWQKEGLHSSPSARIHSGAKYYFEGEECDASWTVTVSHPTYSKKQKIVSIVDGKNIETLILLEPKPMWKICISYSNGVPQEFDVIEDNVENKVRVEENKLGRDYVIEKSRDINRRIVTLKCKKKQFDTNVSLIDRNTRIEERHEYAIKLDRKSKDYSLFSNYANYQKKEKELKDALDNYWGSDDTKNIVSDILTHLQNGHIGKACKSFESIKTERQDRIVVLAKEAIKARQKYHAVIKSPINVTYNYQDHQLEMAVEGTPDNTNKPVFNKDKYVYSLEKGYAWIRKDSVSNYDKRSVVNRKLSSKYKRMYSLVGCLLIAVCVCAIVLLGGNGDLKEQTKDMAEELSKYNAEPVRYVGDDLFDKAIKLDAIITEKYKEDKPNWTDYFYQQYKEQKNYKIEAKQKYDEYNKKLNEINDVLQWDEQKDTEWEDLTAQNKNEWNIKPLSVEQRDNLRTLYEEKNELVKAADNKENQEFKALDFANPQKEQINSYINTYKNNIKYMPHVNEAKKHLPAEKQIMDGPESFVQLATYDNIKNGFDPAEIQNSLTTMNQYLIDAKNRFIMYVQQYEINKTQYNEIYNNVKQQRYETNKDKAKDLIKKVDNKVEENWYNKVDKNYPKSCQDYLLKYPNGNYVNQVKNIVKEHLFDAMDFGRQERYAFITYKDTKYWLDVDQSIKKRIIGNDENDSTSMLFKIRYLNNLDETKFDDAKTNAGQYFKCECNNDTKLDILSCFEEFLGISSGLLNIQCFEDKCNN